MASQQYGIITITFKGHAQDGQNLTFKVTDQLGNETIVGMFWVVQRNNTYQITEYAGSGDDTTGEWTAQDFTSYFNYDWQSKPFIASASYVDPNIVEIRINEGWTISEFNANNSLNASAVITNLPQGAGFLILTKTFQETTKADKCGQVDVKIKANALIHRYQVYGQPVVVLNPAVDEITATLLRQEYTDVVIINDSGDSLSLAQEFSLPVGGIYLRELYSYWININSYPSISNGLSTVIIDFHFGQQDNEIPNVTLYEYSIDGTTYQQSNVFADVLPGDLTVYVKDNFGCVKSTDVKVVGGKTTREQVLTISDLNSINFAKNEVWDGLQYGIYKNKTNTLALTGTEKNLYNEMIIFRDNDNVRIQLKSTYEEHKVSIEDCYGNEISYKPLIVQKSSNLDLFESLDAKIRQHPENTQKTIMYFTQGNIYNESGGDIGDFELNGNLPDSAYIGNLYEIIGIGTYQISSIQYIESIGKKCIVFDFASGNSGTADVIFRSLYDLLPYNIFEFDVSMVLINSTLAATPDSLDEFRVRVSGIGNTKDSNYVYYSEYIKLVSEYDLNRYISILYYNKNNSDIFYSYGIKHFIRMEFNRIDEIIIDEQETSIGDSYTQLTKSIVNKGIKIIFNDMVYKTMIKLSLSLSSEYVFINGIGYVKNDGLSVKKVENTNLFEVEATLIETGHRFNINEHLGNGGDIIYEDIYIPPIIQGNTGLLKQ